MTWRKELVVSDAPLEEKRTILKGRRRKRDNTFVSVVRYSFSGSFIVSCSLISWGVFGQFPQNAIKGILLWLGFSSLVFGLIEALKLIHWMRDEKAWQSIEISERMKLAFKGGSKKGE